MSKTHAKLEHEEFKRNLDRASEAAQTPFEKATVGIFESMGTWLHRTADTACNAHTIANGVRDDLDLHLEAEKSRRRATKWVVGVLGGGLAILVALGTLFNLFCK